MLKKSALLLNYFKRNFNPFLHLTQRIHEKNHLMVFGLYQTWFRSLSYITTMGGHNTRGICSLCFFQNALIFVVDKIPHSQCMISYLCIQKYGAYNYYYLLFWQCSGNVIITSCFVMKWDKNNTFFWRNMAYKTLVKKDENSMKLETTCL